MRQNGYCKVPSITHVTELVCEDPDEWWLISFSTGGTTWKSIGIIHENVELLSPYDTYGSRARMWTIKEKNDP